MALGYDVVFLANKDRHMIGMDFSQTCVNKLLKASALGFLHEI